MSAMQPETLTVLRHIDVHGSRSRAEVVKAFPHMPSAGKAVDNLALMGYVVSDGMSTPKTFILTKKARDKLAKAGPPPRPRSAAKRAQDHVQQLQQISRALGGRSPAPTHQAGRQHAHEWQPQPWDYRPTEYAPSARHGAMAAFELPSRAGGRLHYRDGRVTDLDGNPIE